MIFSENRLPLFRTMLQLDFGAMEIKSI